MAQPDSPNSSSDKPPKRFYKKIVRGITFIRQKQALYILLPLILLNVGILHGVARQMATKASAETAPQVKDETAAASSAGAVTDDNVTEDALPTTVQPVITIYVIKSGDTLSGIADKFNISVNTIRWANDLTTKSTIKVGDELVILPFSGIEYTVKKGDTLSGITVKYGGDKKEIMDINALESEKDIKPGDKLLIPEGEIPATTEPIKQKAPTVKGPTSPTTKRFDDTPQEKSTSTGYFTMPIPDSQITQGLHAVNAVDFGAPIGTAVHAAAKGTVLIAKQGGYNGGFGSYIVINHSNGTQTLYAHLSKVNVSVGQSVSQGDQIANSGNTGKSTGPHMHFEVHGATNPWTHFRVGTHF